MEISKSSRSVYFQWRICLSTSVFVFVEFSDWKVREQRRSAKHPGMFPVCSCDPSTRQPGGNYEGRPHQQGGEEKWRLGQRSIIRWKNDNHSQTITLCLASNVGSLVGFFPWPSCLHRLNHINCYHAIELRVLNFQFFLQPNAQWALRMLTLAKIDHLKMQCKIEFTYQSQKPPNSKVVLEW